MKDQTKGHKNGGSCPKCGGLIQIRTGMTVENGREVQEYAYAQCSR